MPDSLPRPSLALDDQLCFALYSASRAITARYRPLLDELGLTYPQYLVLLVLWESGPVTVSELGQRLYLDSGTLSPLLKRLESAGMVNRQRRSQDERSVEVALTANGHRLRDRATCLPSTILAATGMEITQVARLIGELNAVGDAVRQDLED